MNNKKPIFLELPLHKKLKIFAAITGQRLNKFVNNAVSQYLEQEIKKRKIEIKDEHLIEKSS